MEELKTTNEWLATPEFKGTVIMDPDGWREDVIYDEVFEPCDMAKTKITEHEFNKRLMVCTIMFNRKKDK